MIAEGRWPPVGAAARRFRSQWVYVMTTSAGAVLTAGIVVQHPIALLVMLLVVVVTAAAYFEGPWALGVVFAWMAVAGTGISTGISIGGIHVPVLYVLIAFLMAVAGIRHSVRHSVEQQSAPRLAPALFLALPAVALGALGLFLGNDSTLVREEGLVWIGGALVVALTALTLRSPRHVGQLAVVLAVCGALAAAKSLLVAGSGVLSSQSGLLQVSSSVDPQFQVERIIEAGGDMILTVGVPICVGLLRVARGGRALLLVGVLVLTSVGLVLTYTRTLIAAALIGGVVACLVPLRGQRHTRNLVWLMAGIALVGLLLTFRYGPSQYNAGDAVARRLTGGPQAGSSTLAERTSEAKAALSIDPSLTLTVGRGLGSTFLSPTVPEAGFTDWTHVGYAWVVMKGGIPFLVFVLILFVWSARRMVRAGREAHDNKMFAGAAAGLAGAIVAFAALGALLNPFASVDGLIIFGTLLGAAAIAGQFVLPRNSKTPAADRSSRLVRPI